MGQESRNDRGGQSFSSSLSAILFQVDRLNTLLTEEVNKIQKEMKELRKKAEEIQTEAASKKTEPTEPEAGQVQLKELDSNFSRLSDIVENLQGRLTSQQENSALELEQVQVCFFLFYFYF